MGNHARESHPVHCREFLKVYPAAQGSGGALATRASSGRSGPPCRRICFVLHDAHRSSRSSSQDMRAPGIRQSRAGRRFGMQGEAMLSFWFSWDGGVAHFGAVEKVPFRSDCRLACRGRIPCGPDFSPSQCGSHVCDPYTQQTFPLRLFQQPLFARVSHRITRTSHSPTVSWRRAPCAPAIFLGGHHSG